VLPVSALDEAYIADRSAFSLPFEVTAGEPPQEGPTHGLLFYFEHLSFPKDRLIFSATPPLTREERRFLYTLLLQLLAAR